MKNAYAHFVSRIVVFVLSLIYIPSVSLHFMSYYNQNYSETTENNCVVYESALPYSAPSYEVPDYSNHPVLSQEPNYCVQTEESEVVYTSGLPYSSAIPPMVSPYASSPPIGYTIPLPTPVMAPPPPRQLSYVSYQEVSLFPPPQQPDGPLISIYLNENANNKKRNRVLSGVGIAAAASLVTGGLVLIPALAGVAVTHAIKKSKEKCIYGYWNTYIYEIRAAIGRGLGVPPEHVQLKRKKILLEDSVVLANYMERINKGRIHITYHVKEEPVAGSLCATTNQYAYPTVTFLDTSSYNFYRCL